ncbi:crotonase/enoyl-CoA hydratase family protein [Actinomadura sp. WMMB 499]|uniref:crotonase/enoyl-CoA hydratase family protein n=1 Tax=Actinomadura sp. WMMB 499 TaxID=1219491 RepID=UPI001249137B|nr:crotonase/enoyl-CoA hydratase family protein [Actinomadura sp. WMMB 499]QFG21325.1 crotonase/enoyl-CoA hydratase family protein [Actinomadura sp. WMMB 499]
MSDTASPAAPTDAGEAPEVLVEDREGVLVITLNRPRARNAMTLNMARVIAAALDRLDDDPALRLAVVTGGGGSFCAGMDLKGFLRGERPSIPGRGFGGVTAAPPRKPLIAAVEGWALAGGFELVLACDLVVAASTARFGIPEVKRGLVASAGGLLRLPDRLPEVVAMQLALTGEPVAAERLHALGLVGTLTDEGGALDAALDLARTIAANGPLAVARSKQIMVESRAWPRGERFTRQQPYVDEVLASDDAREGARAFAEKRPADWTGS